MSKICVFKRDCTMSSRFFNHSRFKMNRPRRKPGWTPTSKILTLKSHKFCISTPILELETSICVIQNCWLDEMIPDPIQQQTCLRSWKYSQSDHTTYCLFVIDVHIRQIVCSTTRISFNRSYYVSLILTSILFSLFTTKLETIFHWCGAW